MNSNGWQDDPVILSNKDWDWVWNKGWALSFTEEGSFQFNAASDSVLMLKQNWKKHKSV